MRTSTCFHVPQPPCEALSGTRPSQAAPFTARSVENTVENVENSGRNARSGNNLMTRGANGSLKQPHKFTASNQKLYDKRGYEKKRRGMQARNIFAKCIYVYPAFL